MNTFGHKTPRGGNPWGFFVRRQWVKSCMARWLFLPDTVETDIGILAEASGERLAKLRSVFDSENGFRSYEGYLRVAEILGVSDEEAAKLYTFWEYVQRQRRENEKTGADTFEEFVAFLEGRIAAAKSPEAKKTLSRTLQETKQRRAALTKLFEDCPTREFARKSHHLQSGPLPHLTSVKTFCDVRPIYNEARTEIVDQVALITVRLGLHSGYLDEQKEVLINLSEADVDLIEKEFTRLRQKLAVLKHSSTLKPNKTRRPRGE
jgi:hypothetical protein